MGEICESWIKIGGNFGVQFLKGGTCWILDLNLFCETKKLFLRQLENSTVPEHYVHCTLQYVLFKSYNKNIPIKSHIYIFSRFLVLTFLSPQLIQEEQKHFYLNSLLLSPSHTNCHIRPNRQNLCNLCYLCCLLSLIGQIVLKSRYVHLKVAFAVPLTAPPWV